MGDPRAPPSPQRGAGFATRIDASRRSSAAANRPSISSYPTTRPPTRGAFPPAAWSTVDPFERILPSPRRARSAGCAHRVEPPDPFPPHQPFGPCRSVRRGGTGVGERGTADVFGQGWRNPAGTPEDFARMAHQTHDRTGPVARRGVAHARSEWGTRSLQTLLEQDSLAGVRPSR